MVKLHKTVASYMGWDDVREAPHSNLKRESGAASTERDRLSAILTGPDAKGREELARHLAFETDMEPESAIAILRSAPKANGAAPWEEVFAIVDRERRGFTRSNAVGRNS